MAVGGSAPMENFSHITCESGWLCFRPLTRKPSKKVIGHIVVHPRPRSVAFLPDGLRAFIPSESVGELNVIDTANQKLLKIITLPTALASAVRDCFAGWKKVYVSTGRAGTVCVVDANTYVVLDTIQGRQASAEASHFRRMENICSPPTALPMMFRWLTLRRKKKSARVKSPGSPWGVVAVPNVK